MAVRIINGVKYYPVSERIQFGLESMYDKAQYMMQCEYPDGNITDAEYDKWEALAEECSRLSCNRGWLSSKDYGRAKQITTEREWMRYNRCLAAGMTEREAGQALG